MDFLRTASSLAERVVVGLGSIFNGNLKDTFRGDVEFSQNLVFGFWLDCLDDQFSLFLSVLFFLYGGMGFGGFFFRG